MCSSEVTMTQSWPDGWGARGRVSEYLSRVNRGPVDQANRDDPDVQDFVRPVDARAEEVLLLPVGVVPHVRKEVSGGLDLRSLRLDASPGELNRSQNQRGLRVTHAIESCKVLGPHTEAFLVDHARQLAGKRQHVHPRRAFAEQHRQKLLIAQRRRTFVKELLARAILFRDLADTSGHCVTPLPPDGSG